MKIEMKDIYKSFGKNDVLKGVDFTLNDGEIQQMDSPLNIYNEPKNAFVADFIGESNIIEAKMLEDYKVRFLDYDFPCVDSGFNKMEDVEVVVRPEDVLLVDENYQIEGTVTSLVFKGVHYEMTVDVDGYSMLVQSTEKREVGEKTGIIIKPDLIHVMRLIWKNFHWYIYFGD